MSAIISQQATFWWVALGVGLVVLVVVAAVLTLLLRTLDDIHADILRLSQPAGAPSPGDDLAARADELAATARTLREAIAGGAGMGEAP